MLEWDHNAYYHRLLLGLLPRPCGRVADVGCGAGAFASRLAEHAEQVDAIDRSREMIQRAKRHTPGNVNCVLTDALAGPLPHDGYDAIVSISALHHMPLADALARFGAAVRPGGILAAIALPRRDLLRELPVELVATAGQRLFGAFFLAARSIGPGDWFAKDVARAAMPVVMHPPLTTRGVAQAASRVLPGVRVRRLVFWRYLLYWRKPDRQQGGLGATQ